MTRNLVAVGTILYITLPFLVAVSFSAYTTALLCEAAWQKVEVNHTTVGKARLQQAAVVAICRLARLFAC